VRQHPGAVTINQEIVTMTIKAQRKTIKFCPSVDVEGFLLPDGEFRVGKSSASLALGYQKDYLSRLPKKSEKQFKALLGEGYADSPVSVEVDIERGSVRSETISLNDFEAFIFFSAYRGKKEAIAIQRAITRTGLEDWFRLSFGQQQLTLEEKRDRFYKSYAATINWLEEDRKDWRVIEEQEMFLLSMS